MFAFQVYVNEKKKEKAASWPIDVEGNPKALFF